MIDFGLFILDRNKKLSIGVSTGASLVKIAQVLCFCILKCIVVYVITLLFFVRKIFIGDRRVDSIFVILSKLINLKTYARKIFMQSIPF